MRVDCSSLRVSPLLGFWNSMTLHDLSMTFQSLTWPKFDHLHRNCPKDYLDFCLIVFYLARRNCLDYLFGTINVIFHDFPWPKPKFHDFPGFPLPVQAMSPYTLHAYTCMIGLQCAKGYNYILHFSVQIACLYWYDRSAMCVKGLNYIPLSTHCMPITVW